MNSTIIRRASIVNDGKVFTGDVIIDDGIIEIITHEAADAHADNEIDARGMLLFPGVIDEHVHFRDPGLTNKADTDSESRAAAAGGVTSFMDMPNTIPATTTIDALEAKYAYASTHSLVNYSYYFGATTNNARLLRQIDKKAVCGIKLFMGSSTGGMLVDNDTALQDIFECSDGMLIAAHCEDQTIISRAAADYRAKFGNDVPIDCHPLIRNEEACYRSTAKAVGLANKTGARLHVLHLSTERELSLFESNDIENKRITAEACLPHLLFTSDGYETLGALIKCNPSIKSFSDRQALREALRNGKIDTIATDHAPHLLSEKQGGALQASSGIPMLQFSLVAMLTLAKQGVLSAAEVAEKMCHAPAKLFRIDKRGYIRQGYHADLVLLAPEQWTLSKQDIVSKCGWSPLEGNTFDYKVIKTFVNGQLVYDNGRFNEQARGQRIKFNY